MASDEILERLNATIDKNTRVIEENLRVMGDLRGFTRDLLLRFDKRMALYDARFEARMRRSEDRAQQRHEEIMGALADMRADGRATHSALLALIDRIERIDPGPGSAPA